MPLSGESGLDWLMVSGFNFVDDKGALKKIEFFELKLFGIVLESFVSE